MRSLVATKSGSDPVLRRTIEEAERRRLNPRASVLPSESEGNELLEKTRIATLAATEAMPDFMVKQIIKRMVAFGLTTNWIPNDNLTIAVTYRTGVGEQYKLLSRNGFPAGQGSQEAKDYGDKIGGASSTGEYASGLAAIFQRDSMTTFRMVDTDLLRGRRTIVYEYEVKKPNSQLTLKAGREQTTTAGSRGRVWIDREADRVLRFEQIATEVDPGFPIRAASSVIDYEWVAINEQQYLLPSHADILITNYVRGDKTQSRNEIRFRGYQKFGAELKVIDEIDESDFPPDTPEKSPPTKPQ
jgi:hypothetical protein